MNIAEALKEALPETPSARALETFPRVHPNLVVREHMEREGKMYHTAVPGTTLLFRLTPQQYQLALLFDGKRSYAQVAAAFRQKTGIHTDEATVRRFADNLDKGDFWYRTPQEESIILYQKLQQHRHSRVTKRRLVGDLSSIHIVYFDPDRYLTWLHSKFWWVYTGWFALSGAVMFVVMCIILGSRWSEVWNDSVLFYNFTNKNAWDIVEFFVIFILLAVLHESAHGMTCKHFGGESHKMGMFLVYLLPAMFCDTSQVWVYGGRWARILTVASGVLSEIYLCSIISVVWWFTTPGTWIHEIAYKFILSGGIFVVLVNWNPLTKLDGYYLLCEICRFFDLRGQANALLSATLRKYVFRMPATVPPMPLPRRLGLLSYAVVSGAYCYFVLLFFVRLTYKITYHFSPEWAFIPALLLALRIFRSRIQKLTQFVRALYLDKKEFMGIHWRKFAAAAALLALFGLLPVWRDSFKGRFLLQPAARAVLRAQVAGTVAGVFAAEGDHVRAGDLLGRLRNLDVETSAARAQADYRVAVARATQAQLRYTAFAAADQQRRRMEQALRLADDQRRRLSIASPISGTVVTPRLSDLRGSYLTEGTPFAEVEDTSSLRAEIYVPETEIYRFRDIRRIGLHIDGFVGRVPAVSISVSPAAREMEPGLEPPVKYQGMRPPAMYVLTATVYNADGRLSPGMAGTARVFGPRRSLAGLLLEPLVHAIARRIW